jgi:hypothetical protein
MRPEDLGLPRVRRKVRIWMEFNSPYHPSSSCEFLMTGLGASFNRIRL